MGLIGRGWGIGGSWGYIISPKVKLATVVTLDRLENGMFRVCVWGGGSTYANPRYNCLR